MVVAQERSCPQKQAVSLVLGVVVAEERSYPPENELSRSFLGVVGAGGR